MWDGKYIALGDQEAGGAFQTGIWPSTLSGSALTSSGEVTFSDNCDGDYTDVVDPFLLGKKNTPINNKQGKVMLGENLWCADGGGGTGNGGGVELWHYPAGGTPFKRIRLSASGALVVSLGTGK